jgi:hypothetical protein
MFVYHRRQSPISRLYVIVLGMGLKIFWPMYIFFFSLDSKSVFTQYLRTKMRFRELSYLIVIHKS